MKLMEMLQAGRSCGYTEADRLAIRSLRKISTVVLILFLGMNTLMSMRFGGVLGEMIAALTGVGFAAVIVLGGLIVARGGDEFRRALLLQSLLWVMGVTMVLACVVGYAETFAGLPWHVPVLAVPMCLVFMTAVAKVLVFRARLRVDAEPLSQP